MSLAAFALVVVLLGALGGRLRGLLELPGELSSYRAARAVVAGIVALYAAELALSLAGLAWGRLSLGIPLLSLAALAHWASRAAPSPAVSRVPWGWGTALAWGLVAALAVACALRWGIYVDFVYHWGIKGAKFFSARGIDFAFLAEPWNWMRHPEYPNLVPGFFAAVALAAGSFDEPGLLLISALAFAGLVAATREVLRGAEVAPFLCEATLAAVALCCTMFGLSYNLLGSPDWIIAFAPLAAWPLLRHAGERAADLGLGLVAALAAGSKMEGMALAAFLVGAQALSAREKRLAALFRAATPSLAFIAIWWLQGKSHGLFAHQVSGTFSLAHTGVILGAVLDRLLAPEWYGVSFLIFLLPWLLWCRPTRAIAAVISLQLAFYLYVYFAAPYEKAADVEFFVLSNFSRLLFHLMPTVLVAVGVAWGSAGSAKQSAVLL